MNYYDPHADWTLIPKHMHDAVQRYVMYGISGGSFLSAVMSDSLILAADYADQTNLAALGNWARFIYNYTPSECHGSPERVGVWIKNGGLSWRGGARAGPSIEPEL